MRRKRRGIVTSEERQMERPADEMTAVSQGRRWLLFALALHFGLGAVYIFRFPLWKAPDETGHFLYIEHLGTTGTLPVLSSGETSNYEAHQPPLYYAAAVPFWAMAHRSHEVGLTGQPYLEHHALSAYAIRIFSLLIGSVTIFIIFSIARAFTTTNSVVPSLAALVAATLPMHLFISSAVGNDVLTGVLTAIGLWLLIRTAGTSLVWHRALLIGVVIGFAVLAKMTCLYLLVLALPVIVVRTIVDRDSRGGVNSVLALAAGFLVVSGWWFVRNASLYGDPLAYNIFLDLFAGRPHPGDIIPVVGWGSYLTRWVGLTTFETIFGLFGEVNTAFQKTNQLVTGREPTAGLFGVGALIGAVMVAVMAMGGANALRSFTECASPHRPDAARHAILVIAAVLVVLSFVQFNTHFYQAQARYLYPAYPAWCVFFALGVVRITPLRWHSKALVATVVAMLLLNATILSAWMEVLI